MKKRNLSVLLALSMLASIPMTACSQETGTPDAPASQALPATEQITETAEADNGPKLELPDDLDFGGETFVIHARGDDDSFLEVFTESENGDVLNDSVYARNRAVEERLNMKIEAFRANGWVNYDASMTQLRSSIMAGDNAYQIVAGWKASAPQLTLEGCFFDLGGLPYLDLEKPWWNKAAVEGMKLGGKQFFVAGDISILQVFDGAQIMCFNNPMAADLDIENIPDLIRSGNWTLDKMIEITKAVGGDTNGDGVLNDSDTYGLVLNKYGSADGFYVASDIHQIDMSSGDPVFVPAIDRVTELMEKIYPLYFEKGNGSYMQPDEEIQCVMFDNRQILLVNLELVCIREELRGMEDEFTVIPYPKLNENQKGYYTDGANAATIFGIPVSNPAPDKSAAVIEAMCYESSVHVLPAYYQTCLQDKYARNSETVEMLGIIHDGLMLNGELVYSSMFGKPNYVIRELVEKKSNNVASWYAKNESRITKAIETAMAKIAELN
ncbi:MAG: hypothetical protein MJ175_00595 [Clostridia bacterium]|nr:hypothetical protein [Clostridia bacterium]